MTLLSTLVTSLSEPREALLDALVRTMTLRDEAMNLHGNRVRQYALALAAETGITDASTIAALDSAALLHDIGKLGIPDTVLHKAGLLTFEEYELVKRHVVIGADMLSAMDFPGPLALFVRHHHENWDGTGYPDRLRGEHIPLGARVLSIADCYDALTSDRPYRPALPHARAISMIADARGTMYDPAIADAFVRIVGASEPPPFQPVHRAERTADTAAGWIRRARVV